MQLHCRLVAAILGYLMILGVLCQHLQKPQSEKDTVRGVEDMDFHQHQWLVENDVDEVWMMPSSQSVCVAELNVMLCFGSVC
jgi:hypothetical protein